MSALLLVPLVVSGAELPELVRMASICHARLTEWPSKSLTA